MKEIINRRSIRSYQDKKISQDVIEKLIKSAILAPSAKNNQPWYFIVVNDEIKENIANQLEIELGVNKTSMAINECSHLILVYNTIEEYFSHVSIGAAIENLLLEAESLDLGTLWIGYIKKIEEYVNKLVNCQYELVSAIAIGYKNEEPSARPRKEMNEVCEFK